MDQNCVIPTQQSLEEMKRITMTVIDLDQSNFIPWGLGEEPLFSDATTWTNWSLFSKRRVNCHWVDADSICHNVWVNQWRMSSDRQVILRTAHPDWNERTERVTPRQGAVWCQVLKWDCGPWSDCCPIMAATLEPPRELQKAPLLCIHPTVGPVAGGGEHRGKG